MIGVPSIASKPLTINVLSFNSSNSTTVAPILLGLFYLSVQNTDFRIIRIISWVPRFILNFSAATLSK